MAGALLYMPITRLSTWQQPPCLGCRIVFGTSRALHARGHLGCMTIGNMRAMIHVKSSRAEISRPRCRGIALGKNSLRPMNSSRARTILHFRKLTPGCLESGSRKSRSMISTRSNGLNRRGGAFQRGVHRSVAPS